MRVARRFAVLTIVLVTWTSGSPVHAQVPVGDPAPPPRASTPTIDPRLHAIFDVLSSHGPRSRYFGPEGLAPETRTDGTSALLRFARPLHPPEEAALHAAGVELLRRPDGRALRVRSVYGAFVRREALPALKDHPLLVYAEAAWHPQHEQPLDVTSQQVGGTAHARLPDTRHDGAGRLIVDVDSGIDVLHPHFFFDDGGAFAWIDVDGDGVLDPGVDAVDVDGDGKADGNETLRVLDGAWVDRDLTVHNDDGVFDPTVDWLFADRNRDEQRNVGVEAGFTEFDAAYGEPIFIGDDADRDGVIAPHEKLVRLKTSKIRELVTAHHTYRRGTDLIDAGSLDGLEEAYHGTSVASIAVGGQPRAHQRVGVAPGAELIMHAAHMQGDGFDDAPKLDAIARAVDGGADAILHEWTNPYTAPHDGSGNLEAAMDAAREAGVVQVCPLGNMNASKKHREADVAAGTSADFDFAVGDGFRYGGEVYPYTVVYLSLFWRAETSPTVSLHAPDDGASTVLPLDPTATFPLDDLHVQTIYSRSMRGTSHLIVTMWTDEPSGRLAQGTWTLRVATDDDARFVGRVADYYSGWGVGVHWIDPTADRGTMVYPSTADSSVGVAAFAGRHAQPEEATDVGELRRYSGRGPRIDGARGVDIAAPDDPYAALVGAPFYLDAGYGRGWFLTFGGTSGAGPHVAGAVALMRALDPESSADDVEQRIFQSARRDAETDAEGRLPDERWGHGKLDVYAAIHGATPPDPSEPLVVEAIVEEGDLLTVATPATGDLWTRWDVDYDGVWDTDWVEGPSTALAAGELAIVRVEVVDERGARGGLAALVSRDEDEDKDSGFAPDVGVELDAATRIESDAEQRELSTERRGCPGCSSSSNGTGAWTPLFLIGVIVLRARRRRHSTVRTGTAAS